VVRCPLSDLSHVFELIDSVCRDWFSEHCFDLRVRLSPPPMPILSHVVTLSPQMPGIARREELMTSEAHPALILSPVLLGKVHTRIRAYGRAHTRTRTHIHTHTHTYTHTRTHTYPHTHTHTHTRTHTRAHLCSCTRRCSKCYSRRGG
jgi:hypothetical protein